MHTARSQDSGANLTIDDGKLYTEQQTTRIKPQPEHNHPPKAPTLQSPVFQPGDTVTPYSTQPKHKVRDMYLVTKSAPEQVTVQRVLHPTTEQPTKFMSRQYVTQPKRLQLLHRPPIMPPNLPNQPDIQTSPPTIQPWSPINSRFSMRLWTNLTTTMSK